MIDLFSFTANSSDPLNYEKIEFRRLQESTMTAATFDAQIIPQKTEGNVELLQNSPNPFIEMTLLWFRLPAAANVLLRIFDAMGKEVNAKAGQYQSGENHMLLHRADLQEPGFYTCRLETPYGTASRKLMMY
jgi:hypothetical protein